MIRRVLAAACLAVVPAAPAAAQQRLGTVHFPTSAAPVAQAHFERGVKLLHSFEYADAAQAFLAAQQAEPGFALAYWGEAMTYTHPLWNEQDLPRARAALARLGPTPEARAATAPTPRERAYLAAVEALYGEGSKPRRDTLYLRAVEQLVAAYPDDDEAKAFQALALMGLSQGTRDVPAYMRAGAIALELLGRHPDHPGAAHYVIHAFDDPVHAPLGLPAARAYSRIAPDADHAQHMTTHIFLALGMWPEVVAQNTVAQDGVGGAWFPGHYTHWLHYGLLQQGKFDEAAALLERVRSGPLNPGRRAHLLLMRAQQVINAEQPDAPSLAWPVETAGLGPWGLAQEAFARGWVALRRGDAPAAERRAAELDALAQRAASLDPMDRMRGTSAVPAIMAKELRALLHDAAGRRADALALAREAAEAEAALPMEFGPPDVVKPGFELLGELLLAAGDERGAQAAFERSLALAPNRLRSRQGLARTLLSATTPAASRNPSAR